MGSASGVANYEGNSSEPSLDPGHALFLFPLIPFVGSKISFNIAFCSFYWIEDVVAVRL